MSFSSRRRVLQLERDLFERQQALIEEALGPASAALARYQAEYLASTRVGFRAAGRDEVRARIALCDVAFVGDYHTLPAAQATFAALVGSAARTGRKRVVALELFGALAHPALDRFSAGQLSVSALLKRAGVDLDGSGGSREAFGQLLERARAVGAELLAIDLPAEGPKRIARRDAHAAQRIAARSLEADRPLILALVGQFHVSPGHLPARVAALTSGQRRLQVVYQNPEHPYFEARSRGRVPEALVLDDGALALLHTPPAACQQTFLDLVDGEEGDEVPGPSLERAFVEAASAIAEAVRVDGWEALEDLEVLSARSLPAAEALLSSGRLRVEELEVLRQAALTRQSCFLPRARVVYLGRRSRAHLAEEAAHFVRHLCVAEAMTRPRPRAEAFHARCLEEAIGFLGSRLLHPARRATSLSEWSALYRRRGEGREVAAWVLAHKDAEREGDLDAALVPSDDETFHGASHALGYLLGEALHTRGTSRSELGRLFRDPFNAPTERYLQLVRRAQAPRTTRRAA